MQYTQQQRLAPEAPDESTLYSPILQKRHKALGLFQLSRLSRLTNYRSKLVNWIRIKIYIGQHSDNVNLRQAEIFEDFQDGGFSS